MTDKSAKIFALTEVGKVLAERIIQANKLDPLLGKLELSFKPEPFKQTVQEAFLEGRPLVFICATGIVVRVLADVIRDKYQDPPVLVCDEHGQFVIPLLSGHEGGANELARRLALSIGAESVLTTAKPYTKPHVAVGIGCERGCSLVEIEELLQKHLAELGLSLADIAAISSIDIKADERALMALSEKLNVPFLTFSARKLSEYDDQLTIKSEYVHKTVGVFGVAEAAALASFKGDSELILPKQKSKRATLAVARLKSV